jgi:hypothetical protein
MAALVPPVALVVLVVVVVMVVMVVMVVLNLETPILGEIFIMAPVE